MSGDIQTTPNAIVEIYTDGGCEPNPGPGGYGAVLLHPKKRHEVSAGFRLTTNNRMEIYAAIAGLQLLNRPCKVTLYTDSQYLADSMMKGWVAKWKKNDWWQTNQKRAENIDLWEKLLPLCEMHQVEFSWVRGHTGVLENERCDQLAMAALRGANPPPDEGYENKPESEGRRPDLQVGDPCRKCGTSLIRKTSQKKPKGDFYYEFYLLCPNPTCRTTYTVEGAKRAVQQPPSLF
jgi:ribonuclease HI